MKKCTISEEMVECFYNGAVVKVPVDLFASMTLGVPVKEKKFVRYKDGAKMYGMGQTEFIELVRDAEAVYKRHNMVLVNIEILDRFLEYFNV